jgi:hypothetical protein
MNHELLQHIAVVVVVVHISWVGAFFVPRQHHRSYPRVIQ